MKFLFPFILFFLHLRKCGDNKNRYNYNLHRNHSRQTQHTFKLQTANCMRLSLRKDNEWLKRLQSNAKIFHPKIESTTQESWANLCDRVTVYVWKKIIFIFIFVPCCCLMVSSEEQFSWCIFFPLEHFLILALAVVARLLFEEKKKPQTNFVLLRNL